MATRQIFTKYYLINEHIYKQIIANVLLYTINNQLDIYQYHLNIYHIKALV